MIDQYFVLPETAMAKDNKRPQGKADIIAIEEMPENYDHPGIERIITNILFYALRFSINRNSFSQVFHRFWSGGNRSEKKWGFCTFVPV
jgi:hypothetical protein